MIKKIECYIAICDICEKSVDVENDYLAHFDTEDEAMKYATTSDEFGGADCEMIDGKLCCMSCWVYGDDDEPAIRSKD